MNLIINEPITDEVLIEIYKDEMKKTPIDFELFSLYYILSHQGVCHSSHEDKLDYISSTLKEKNITTEKYDPEDYK